MREVRAIALRWRRAAASEDFSGLAASARTPRDKMVDPRPHPAVPPLPLGSLPKRANQILDRRLGPASAWWVSDAATHSCRVSGRHHALHPCLSAATLAPAPPRHVTAGVPSPAALRGGDLSRSRCGAAAWRR